MTQDRIITCTNCGQEFAFTASEAEFYAQKGLQPPTLCLICRSLLKTAKADQFRGTVSQQKKRKSEE